MSQWERVATVDDLPLGTGKELIVDGKVIALFHVDGTFHALDGVCPHAGGPLADGKLTGCMVTCPWHGWQFDVATGQHGFNEHLKHTSFPVKVDGDAVFIDISP